jgi:TonB-dependent SusC/RagA subfamily outer membrane receptor
MLGLFILMIPFALSAQNISVSGTVHDSNNEPLPGVNVVQTGTTNGTITDLDGKYSLSVPSDATLTFSYIGFTNHVENVNGRTNIPPITLESDDKEIEQVVVVGYGTQRKSDLTGSVASVGGDEMKNRATSDAAAALQGKAAGVQVLTNSGAPGKGAEIRVRGVSSNSGSLGPLLIVDGLKVDNIQYLDPEMIESMEILKDAASAAIYGAEAGNGVVLITTKNGAKSKDGQIFYNAQFSLS